VSGRPDLDFGSAESLLDDVGGVELAPQARVQTHPGQQEQVLSEAVEGRVRGVGVVGHDSPPRIQAPKAGRLSAPAEQFS
jgi:hypothetical protein